MRVDDLALDLHVGNAVGSARHHQRESQHGGTVLCVGAAIEHNASLPRHQRPIAHRAGTHPDLCRVACSHHHEVVRARQHELDRLARAHRHKRRHRLYRRVALAAKCPAHARQDHAHLGHRYAQDLRSGRLDPVHRLARGPDHDAAGVVYLGHRSARLQIAMHLGRGFVAALHHHIRLRKCGGHIALGHGGLCTDIDRQGAFETPPVFSKLRMNCRCAIGQRILGRRQGGQLVVVDLDQIERLTRCCQVIRRHGCHRISRVPYDVRSQHFLVLDKGAITAGKVGTGQDAPDARQGERCRDINRHDACVWIRREQVGAVQHAVAVNIVDEDGTSVDLFSAVQPRNILADTDVLRHGFLPPIPLHPQLRRSQSNGTGCRTGRREPASAWAADWRRARPWP